LSRPSEPLKQGHLEAEGFDIAAAHDGPSALGSIARVRCRGWTTEQDGPAGEPTRILVVDDDPRLRTVVRRGLAYEGYRVVEAATGEEGSEKAREHLPELVVLDRSSSASAVSLRAGSHPDVFP
jgi:hypothetical protein